MTACTCNPNDEWAACAAQTHSPRATPDLQEYADRILTMVGRQKFFGTLTQETHEAFRALVDSLVRAINRAEEGLAECVSQRNRHTRLDPRIFDTHVRRYTEARDDAWAALDIIAKPYGVTRPMTAVWRFAPSTPEADPRCAEGDHDYDHEVCYSCGARRPPANTTPEATP